MTTRSFRYWAGRLMCLLLTVALLGSCTDEEIVKTPSHGLNSDGSVTFSISIPDYVVETRAGGSFDKDISTIHLYLFDERGGFIGIIDAEEVQNATDKDYELNVNNDGSATVPSPGNSIGTYKAEIPQNTEVVHFIANAPSEFWPGDANTGMDMNYYRGLKQQEVIIPMTTSEHLYWGTSTYSNLVLSEQPVILYRNYAKVEYNLENDAENILGIDGWVLCNRPQNATVAPFDANDLQNPFHFNLLSATAEGNRFASLPVVDKRMEALLYGPYTKDEAGQITDADLTANVNSPLSIFDYTVDGYGDYGDDYGEEVFAVFKIRTPEADDSNSSVDDGVATVAETEGVSMYYKIKFYQEERNNEGIVVKRNVFDIKRNHIYTINFKGINPKLGYSTIAEAMKGNAANGTMVDVEESIPELQSASSTLRVANGTVRYIDDLTARFKETSTGSGTYEVDNIYIYYETTAGTDVKPEVKWETDSCHWDGELPSLRIRAKEETDSTGNYNWVIEFDTTPFSYDEEKATGTNHYKEGVIRISEPASAGGVLSRFVRVYIGDPITFRPLLISSDIPAMTDERLTVAFTVPNERYLPTRLYPIEVRFGSDRVDVEKSLTVDAMKVDLVATDYKDVLQYKNGTNGWYWYADKNGATTGEYWATAAEWKKWGYKYTYTIEEPADSGEHRITLRTVTDDKTDFSVIMEGQSVPLRDGTGYADMSDMFNTRELRFKVQPETTNATARRIMLDDGLYNTRLTTRYVNVPKPASGNTANVSIPYTLGFYSDTETGGTQGQADYIVGHRNADEKVTSSDSVKLWIYYRPEDLTPTGVLAGKTVKTDPEGNTFVEYGAKSPTGTFTFTTKSLNVKNSLVFITARSYDGSATNDRNTYTTMKHPYWGDYASSSHKSAAKPAHGADYLYTGVNTGSKAYRSASALVSVLGTWEFNAVISDRIDLFQQTAEQEMPYGKSNDDSHDFFVRIDRPAGVSGINLVVTPEVAKSVKLMENNNSYTITNNGEDGNPIKLTLGSHADSVYSVLRFRPLKFDHAGILTFTNGTANASGISYSEEANNEVSVSHTPIAVQGIKYILRSDYDKYRAEDEGNVDTETGQVLDDKFSSSLNIDPASGEKYVVRIYFPASLSFRMDGSNDVGNFTFKFATLKSEVLDPATEFGQNDYADSYDILDDNVIKVNRLRKIYYDANGAQTNSSTTHLNYIDLLLQSTEGDSDETMRISTGNDLNIYRYSVGIGNRVIYEPGNAKVKYELSSDSTAWTAIQPEDILTNFTADLYEKDKTVYLRVTYPVNNDNDVVDFTLKTSGFYVTACDRTYASMKVMDQSGTELSSPTVDSNNNCYYWTYEFDDIATVKAAKGQFVLTLQTIGYGLADYLKMKGENKDIIVEETAFTVATAYEPENYSGKWSLSYTAGAPQTTSADRTGDGNQIFDVGTQVNQLSKDEGYTYPSGYTYASKMDGAAYVSFYASYSGMKLQVGVTQRKTDNNGGLAIYYNGSETPYYTSEAITGNTPMTVIEKELSSAGLYQLRNPSGEFFLYYVNLEKSREAGSLGTITWTAADTDGSVEWQNLYNSGGTRISYPIGNATDGAITLGEDNTISVSDFAEQLTLTFASLPETVIELTLPENGVYAFLSGTEKVFTVTNVASGSSVTIVPKDGGELKDEVIALSGYSNTYTFMQDIQVFVRPYIVHTAVYDATPVMGDTIELSVTMPDAQHAENANKAINFKVGGYGTWNILEAIQYPTGWTWAETNKAVFLSRSNITQNYTETFKWRVESYSGNQTYIQIRPGDKTDYCIWGNIKNNGPVNSLSISTRAKFMQKASDGQGYLQYSTNNTEWTYVNGTDGKKLDATFSYYANYNANEKTGACLEQAIGQTLYVRVSVPNSITSGITPTLSLGNLTDASYSASINGVTAELVSVADGWATCKLTLDENTVTAGQHYGLHFVGDGQFADQWNASAITYVKITETSVWQWRDIYLNLTQQGLLTDTELSNMSEVSYGILIDADGNHSRVEATNESANAVISGNYHNDHGWHHAELEVKVEGPVKIGVGNCTYADNTITVKDGTGTQVMAFSTYAECWKNNNNSVSYAYYTGGETTLTIKTTSYTPYISVEKVDTVPTLYGVNFYNQSYTTSSATYTLYRSFQQESGTTLKLPGNYPSGATHWAACSTTTSYGYNVEQKTQIEGSESVNADMQIYPVSPVTVGSSAATVSPEDVYHAEGCYTRKGNSQLIESAGQNDYILFDIKPEESGIYKFTAPIGTPHDNMKVTLGYVDANGNYQKSEQKAIINNGNWTGGNNYSWNFNLTAGTTYTFKMTCDTQVDNGTCANVYEMTVEKTDQADVSVIWPFNSDNYATDYAATLNGVTATVNIGTLKYNGTATGNDEAVDESGTKVTFVKLTNESTTSTDELVTWTIQCPAGFKFTPTKITGYIQRFGTDVQSGVKVSANNTLVGTFTAPRNNKTSSDDNYKDAGDYVKGSKFEITNFSGVIASDSFTLSATIGVKNSKDGGFSDIRVYGTMTKQ